MAPVHTAGGEEVVGIIIVLIFAYSVIHQLCIAIWNGVSEVCWAIWTFPPLEAFRKEFVTAVVGLTSYVITNPITSLVVFLLALIVIPAIVVATVAVVLAALFLGIAALSVTFYVIVTPFLYCLGYKTEELLRDPYTVNYQSTSYGGNVPRISSLFTAAPNGTRRR